MRSESMAFVWILRRSFVTVTVRPNQQESDRHTSLLTFIRSTPPSRPNKVGLKCPPVHKKFLRFQWNSVCR